MESATLYASHKSQWTDEELMVLPRDGRKHELLDGDLLMSPQDVLIGGQVLPGFKCRLSRLFHP